MCCLYKYFRCLYTFLGFTTHATAPETDERGQCRLTRLMRTRHCSFGVIYSIESLNGPRYFVIAFTNPSRRARRKADCFCGQSVSWAVTLLGSLQPFEDSDDGRIEGEVTPRNTTFDSSPAGASAID